MTHTVTDRKARIRAEALARRDALDPGFRLEVARTLAQAGRACVGDVAGLVVSGFWPIRSELDPRHLMRALAQNGARLALPRIEAGQLVFRGFAFGDRLVRAGFGLSEPGPQAQPAIPDIMLVPLAAFDRRGGRIGYGKGYYDGAIGRLLGDGARPRPLGLAFACQEVADVPLERHDRRLEAVLTERGLIEASP